MSVIEEDHDHHDHESTAYSSTPVIGWILTGVVISLLAIGPLVQVFEYLPPTIQSILVLICSPLDLLTGTPFAEPITWYVELWI